MSMARHQKDVKDSRIAHFWDMIRVLRHYIHMAQKQLAGYIVESIQVFGSSKAQTLKSVHHIHSVLGTHVLSDVLAVGSRAHHSRL